MARGTGRGGGEAEGLTAEVGSQGSASNNNNNNSTNSNSDSK